MSTPANFNGAKPIIDSLRTRVHIVALGDGAASIASQSDLSQ